MGDYQPLRLDADCDAKVRNRIKYPKEKNKKNIYYKKPMSLSRAIAFSASIVLCILTIGIFLWIVPCDWDTCPVQQSTSWDRIYYGLEFKGPLNIVQGTHGLNLVGMFQGALWGHDSKDSFPSYGGGVISLVGSSGVIAWWTQLVNIPLHLDCSLIDANKDGVSDCLVQGKDGYLGLIDALSGVVIWSIQKKGHANSKNRTIEDISFPIILPDINGDGVNEILALGRFNFQEYHIIILICGKTGEILGNPLENKDCSDIDNLMVETKDLTLYTYTCKRESKSDSYNIESLTLQELVFKITNISLGNIDVGSVAQPYIKHLNSDWVVGKHHLSPVNRGLCPGNCSVMVNVTDDNDRPLFSYFAERTYVMKPEIIHFNPSISGFLLKLWQWGPANNQVISKTNMIYIHSIMEQVVLLTFNDSKTADVVNASQADIIQLCTDKMCQPELESQTDSLLLVDLDEDGFQELISYMVTYKSSSDECIFNCTSENKWKLQTKVRVIRLQAELPKLYENIGHKR